MTTPSIKMANTPQQLFPTWYKNAEHGADSALIKKRIDAIEGIIENEQVSFWMSLVKLYLGVAIGETEKSDFVNFFTTEDTFFPIENNEHILRILASSTIAFKLNSEKSQLTYTISLSVITANFLKQFNLSDVTYVYQYASANLESSGSMLRKAENVDMSILDNAVATLEEQKEDENIEVDVKIETLTTTILEVAQLLKRMDDRHTVVSEESDTLWWLYGGYSTIGKNTFEKIGLPKMIVFSAVDLYNKTYRSVGLVKANEFILKALAISDKKKAKDPVEIYEVIGAFGTEERKLVTQYYKSNYSVLTPCISAFAISLEMGVNDPWDNLYKSRNYNAEIKTKVGSAELAFQIYNELMLLWNL